jgi:hypothetical protein
MSEADHLKAEPIAASLSAFARDLYGAPGVAEACLALPHRPRCDVDVVRFAASMAAVHRRAVLRAELTTLERLAGMRHTTQSRDGGNNLENLEVAIQHFRGTEPSGEALELVGVIAEGLRTRAALAAHE